VNASKAKTPPARPTACAWWHQPTQTPQQSPLELLREAAQAMEAGEPVPMPAARVLVKALRQYLAGTETDITRALGLRPRKGGAAELPTRLERTKNRNDLICRMFNTLDGGDVARAEHVARMLTEPHQRSEINEADLFACMEQLHQQYGGELPSSGRHILRIVRGETVASRTP
jgi:hypothetical protein